MSSQGHEHDLIQAWLDETYEAERDSAGFLDHVIDAVPTTPQRPRRWWHRMRSGRPARLSRGSSTDDRPDPVKAPSGRTPTVFGRTTSMLSPAKAVITATLVLSIGGVMLVARPISQPATDLSAAEGAVSTDPAWVSGTILHAASCTSPERTAEGDVVHETGYRCDSQIWETDDVRLNGTATSSWNADVYRLGPDASVAVGVYEVVTDAGGGWLCSSGPSVAEGSGLFASTQPETITCSGQDAYAGLTAVLDVDLDADSIEGLVFANDLPTSPEVVSQ